MDDARNQDGEQESRTHKTSNKHFRNHKYRMLFGAVMLLAIGFAPGYFVGAMRHDNTPAENYEQSAQEDANTELAEESFEEEPFESAPIKQAPEKQADSADTVEAMTVKIQDSVLTTWTYEGTDKKSHTKTIIMIKTSVTNNSDQSLVLDTYPLNLKDKNNELMNATYYAFQPDELSWYGGFLHYQTVPPGETVVGVITMEIPSGSYDAGKAPLKLQLEKLDKTLEVTPREVSAP